MEKTSLKNNLRIGLGLSLLILFVSSLASYKSITNLIESADLVSHSNEVMTSLDAIISTLKDAETGQRGYLLTGDKVFQEPFNGAKQSAVDLLSKVTVATQDNKLQQENAGRLRQIIEGRLSVIEKTIEMKDRGETITVSELLEGKKYMDDARALIKTMQGEEKRLLDERTGVLNQQAGYTPLLILIAAALAVLITLFFYMRVSRDFTARVKLQEELKAKNEEIDNRIEVIQGIAGQISNGDYQLRLGEDVKDGLGSLALSLNAMAESLQYSFSLLADKEWLQTGIAGLNDKMVGEKGVENLASDILENIIEHTQSIVGAFYILGEDKML